MEKEYRYVSEQVSHHPPISACWAEAPRWRYYGEVDAQNKFTGKSFEIRPTGGAHADLLLPAALGPGYPACSDATSAGDGPKVVEHFSWKKVTTCVSGFLLGSPTIDHCASLPRSLMTRRRSHTRTHRARFPTGDCRWRDDREFRPVRPRRRPLTDAHAQVTNHRTGDTCVLTFKPRGWRAKDAFEISGYVADARGVVKYELAGRWNSQLVARAVGAGGGGVLNPDGDVPGAAAAAAHEFILLWRNSVKPPAPFNLTPFAITLNDCPAATLRPYIAPTDCRLRPDQRAFERGRYERANALKGAQEERQRAIRRARETGQRAPHRPRWFVAETEGDTGERVWNPVRVAGEVEYWRERARVYDEGGAGKTRWTDVDQIFIEDEA
jgi:hypothetical protein